ncbi:hypothetical protein [Enhygromyxa salina]|uniref:Uncharacterized protein n=1 Tax=Enhygromyxa salina TaxID=215803 RepID=A0A2S9YI70_9BACT|nr:hypothetical protein [Enhygromyxa salina]PRQ04779.1 hypothetical protein ENSA7_49520 [Enhygromyxa salina]
MKETDAEDDLDDSTKPLTHAQIGEMLNEAERPPVQREYPVDLDYFLGFGDAGTPTGMIGSHANHGGPAVSGFCGDRPRPPRVEARAPQASILADLDLYPWGPAPAELGGAPEAVSEAPVPWSLPEPVTPPVAAVASIDRDDAGQEDLRRAGLRSRTGLVAGLALLLACGLGSIVWWVILPERAPPPEPPELIAAVVTNYEEDEFDAEPPEPTENVETVVGRVSVEGPSEIEQIKPWKTERCATQREHADDALRKGEWDRLEELSRESKCWRPSRKAKVLRMNALFELGRTDECVRVGAGSSHPEIKKWMRLCTRSRDPS